MEGFLLRNYLVKKFQRLRAFTLIEMLVTISIIGILTGIGVSILVPLRATKEVKNTADRFAVYIAQARTQAMAPKTSDFGLSEIFLVVLDRVQDASKTTTYCPVRAEIWEYKTASNNSKRTTCPTELITAMGGSANVSCSKVSDYSEISNGIEFKDFKNWLPTAADGSDAVADTQFSSFLCTGHGATRQMHYIGFEAGNPSTRGQINRYKTADKISVTITGPGSGVTASDDKVAKIANIDPLTGDVTVVTSTPPTPPPGPGCTGSENININTNNEGSVVYDQITKQAWRVIGTDEAMGISNPEDQESRIFLNFDGFSDCIKNATAITSIKFHTSVAAAPDTTNAIDFGGIAHKISDYPDDDTGNKNLRNDMMINHFAEKVFWISKEKIRVLDLGSKGITYFNSHRDWFNLGISEQNGYDPQIFLNLDPGTSYLEIKYTPAP